MDSSFDEQTEPKPKPKAEAEAERETDSGETVDSHCGARDVWSSKGGLHGGC